MAWTLRFTFTVFYPCNLKRLGLAIRAAKHSLDSFGFIWVTTAVSVAGGGTVLWTEVTLACAAAVGDSHRDALTPSATACTAHLQHTGSRP